ncbi:MAG: YIP1 family protein [Acidobacteria bacterium]|nr:YIP1 family protein [Acidobacteriota bacterium]
MTETPDAPTEPRPDVARRAAARDVGLVGRLVGVIFTPRKTFEGIARRPLWLGALLTVALVIAAASTWLVSTELGQQMLLEQQVSAMESFGLTVSDEMYDQLRRRLASAVYFTAGGVLVSMPLVALVVASVVWVVGYVGFGGGASFRQMFAVVAHVGAINIVQQLFVIPLNYARGAMSNPTTIAAFFPMIEDGTFAARALGLIDLFVIWQLSVLAVGVAVLYKRRTGMVATVFYLLYAVIAVGGGFALSRMGG